jgi:flagellar biosynthetic protein FliR
VGGGAVNLSIGNTAALAFGLLFTRAAALIVALPAMLGVSVPVRVRLLLALLLAAALMPGAAIALPKAGGLLTIAVLVLREAAVGMTLSLAGALVVGAVTIVGELAGSNMELANGAILRGTVTMPNSLADGLGTMTGLLFFIAGFQRSLLIALGQSLRVAPLGRIGIPDPSGVLALGGRMFSIAFGLALPLLVPLFVLALAQGAIARLAPQINILIAAPAAIALAGLVLLGLDAYGLTAGIMRAWSVVMAAMLRWSHG